LTISVKRTRPDTELPVTKVRPEKPAKCASTSWISMSAIVNVMRGCSRRCWAATGSNTGSATIGASAGVVRVAIAPADHGVKSSAPRTLMRMTPSPTITSYSRGESTSSTSRTTSVSNWPRRTLRMPARLTRS
jgi:hypothetical protein